MRWTVQIILVAVGSITLGILVTGKGAGSDKREEKQNVRSAPKPAAKTQGDREYRGKEFVLKLTEAKIAYPPLKAKRDETEGPLKGVHQRVADSISQEKKMLLLTFEIKNLSERKIIQYSPYYPAAATFLDRFDLVDDVGNRLSCKNVPYWFGGFGVVGQVEIEAGGVKIKPGQVLSDLHVFEPPPPKTEYLVLTISKEIVDFNGIPLAEQGSKFKILISEIKGYDGR